MILIIHQLVINQMTNLNHLKALKYVWFCFVLSFVLCSAVLLCSSVASLLTLQWYSISNSSCLTGWSPRLMPTRNRDSAINRLMHRFLWMVLRSLWRPRKKQNVKRLMSRQTRDRRIPTHVMTSSSMSCTGSGFWKREEPEEKCGFLLYHLPKQLMQLQDKTTEWMAKIKRWLRNDVSAWATTLKL